MAPSLVREAHQGPIQRFPKRRIVGPWTFGQAADHLNRLVLRVLHDRAGPSNISARSSAEQARVRGVHHRADIVNERGGPGHNSAGSNSLIRVVSAVRNRTYNLLIKSRQNRLIQGYAPLLTIVCNARMYWLWMLQRLLTLTHRISPF